MIMEARDWAHYSMMYGYNISDVFLERYWLIYWNRHQTTFKG